MMFSPRTIAAALLFAASTPVLAQSAAPAPPPAAPSAAAPPARGASAPPARGAAAPRGEVRNRPGQMHHRGMFSSLSEAGRATMRDAMTGDMAARQSSRDAVKAARDRMLVLLEAERLDVAALKRAMADERAAANASHERRQAAMAAGFAKLSLADRRAFVTEARATRARMEERMKGWRGRMGGADDMPEPPMLF